MSSMRHLWVLGLCLCVVVGMAQAAPDPIGWWYLGEGTGATAVEYGFLVMLLAVAITGTLRSATSTQSLSRKPKMTIGSVASASFNTIDASSFN